MRLLLVRHAKAFERDAAAWPDDLRRPLTAEGRDAFIRLAKRLGQLERSVDCVLASPAVRAWQTAQILHERAGWPAPQRCETLLPEDAVVQPAAAETGREPAASLAGFGGGGGGGVGAGVSDTAGPAAWTRMLAALPDDAVVAWVGHEPTLGRIASWLLTGEPNRVNLRCRKGSVTAIERERGMASLAWMVTPRIAARWK
jgi:phosphohistidine phosphatase SixA